MPRTPIDYMLACGAQVARSWDLWLGRAAGANTLAAATGRRLGALVRHARCHVPLYRELYRGLPDDPRLDSLPVTTKPALMARFDDWVADRALTLDGVRRFVADRTRIGDRYLDRYVIWKSSGTSGVEGIFVQDDDALSVYDALLAVQLASPVLAARCVAGSMLLAGRAALVTATGDHFAGIASWERVCRASPVLLARRFAVTHPLPLLVAELETFAPAYLASYPTTLALLAQERRAGRLHVAPTLVWSGGENLAPALHDDLERAFACPVINEYGASECLSIGFGCAERWVHVNADWVIVEPVDADHRPTPTGRPSHTVLVTNLANLVQPIIRYDLGDSVVMHPGRCACGNPLPALRVEGRQDDIVVVRDGDREVRIPPMALSTVIEEAIRVHAFQVVQRGPRELRLRVPLDDPESRDRALRKGTAALREYLSSLGIGRVLIVADVVPPRADARSGKVRQVVVEPTRPRSAHSHAPHPA